MGKRAWSFGLGKVLAFVGLGWEGHWKGLWSGGYEVLSKWGLVSFNLAPMSLAKPMVWVIVWGFCMPNSH